MGADCGLRMEISGCG
ncbi:hypothetical protein AB3S75_011275 [Citrus x aurantiifolia]